MAGEELVEGDFGDDLDLIAAAARGAGEEGAGGAGVDVVPVGLNAGEDEGLGAVGGERFEDGCGGVGRAGVLGEPVFHGHAVGDVEGLETMSGRCGAAEAREHGVEEGEG